MSEPTSLAELLGKATPEPKRETRVCQSCKEEKVLTMAEWPFVRGKPAGRNCRPCEKKRQKVNALKAATPEAVEAKKLEIAAALKQGAQFLNSVAPAALARLEEYIADIEHPLHQWAIQFVVERALPRKLYEEMGSKEAGLGGPADKRPTFVVNVVQATSAQPGEVKAIDARVTVVPAIEERPDEQGQ